MDTERGYIRPEEWIEGWGGLTYIPIWLKPIGGG